MARWASAPWWGPADSNYSGHVVECRGLVVHIAEGSFDGTVSWQRNPDADVSSNFVTDYDGAVVQMVDTDTQTAWTQATGNGHWISNENAGFHGDILTDAQIEANAEMFAWIVQTYGVPLKLAAGPNDKGLGWHGMGGTAWGGHPDCPGPRNVSEALPRILNRAVQIVTGAPIPPPPEDDVINAILTHDLNGDYIFLIPSAGGWRRLPKALVDANSWVLDNALVSFQRAGMGVDQKTWAANSYDFSDPAVIGQWGHELVPCIGGGGGLVDHNHSGGTTGGVIPTTLTVNATTGEVVNDGHP